MHQEKFLRREFGKTGSPLVAGSSLNMVADEPKPAQILKSALAWVSTATLWLGALGTYRAQGAEWQSHPDWEQKGEVVTGSAGGPIWSDLLCKEQARHGTLSGVVQIAKARSARDSFPGNRGFYGKGTGTQEFFSGYEAGVILRNAEGRCYRVWFSVALQEVALWRTDGGILGVAPCELKAATNYPFEIAFSGDRIRISVGGKPCLAVRDTRAIDTPGAFGLSVKQGGLVQFANIRCSPDVSVGDWQNPLRGFSQRTWRGEDWFFYGDEPIAQFEKQEVFLHYVKLASHFRPIGNFPVYFMHYGGARADKQIQFHVKEIGPRLVFRVQGTTAGQEMTSTYQVTVTCDQGTHAFLYDVQADALVNEGKRWSQSLEFLNLTNYGGVGPSVSLSSQEIWPTRYQWVVWKAKDAGLYKHAMNHNGYYPGYAWSAGQTCLHLAPDGYLGYVTEEVNPVMQLLAADADVKQELCAWQHDIHLKFQPAKPPLAAGTRRSVRYVLTGWDRARGAQVVEKSKLPAEARNAEWAYPVYQAGKNDFKTGVTIASPHSALIWRKLGRERAWEWAPDYWDQKVGHDDTFSLRVDGPFSLSAGIGPSWFQGREQFQAKRHLVQAYVKTQNVRGAGPYLAFEGHNNLKDNLLTELTGTHGWTRVGFVTDKLHGFVFGDLTVGLNGTGTVWFDDVEILPLRDDEGPPKIEWERSPISPPSPNAPVVQLPMDEGAGQGALDQSHHGNSALLVNVRWAQDPDRGNCLELDGSSVVLIQDKPKFIFPKGFTISMLIKPSANVRDATLVRWYNDLTITLGGAKPPYGVGARINSSACLASACVPADQWSRIVVSYNNRKLKLFVDGRKVGEGLGDGSLRPLRMPLCVGQIYHDGRLQSAGYRGLLSELNVWDHALPDLELITDPQQRAEAEQAAKLAVVSQNLIKNGGFEKGIQGWKANQHMYGQRLESPAPLVDIAWEQKDTANSSPGALRFRISQDLPPGKCWTTYCGALARIDTAAAGSELKISFWARSVSGSRWLAIGREAGGSSTALVEINQAWRKYEVWMQVGYSTTSLVFGLCPPQGQGLRSAVPLVPGEALLDNVEVRAGE